jgi:hypothetical protein
MRKILSLSLALVLVLSLTGCFGSKLEEGQGRYSFNKDGELNLEMSIEDKDLDDMFDADFDDKTKDIEDDIMDEWEDTGMEDAEIKSLKKKGDYLYLEIFIEDGEDVSWNDLDYTLEDYLEDSYYEDYDDLQEEVEFVEFKSEDEIDEDDLEDYEDNLVLTVYGGEEGMYWVVPDDIVLVSGDCKYERISATEIYVEDDYIRDFDEFINYKSK